MTVGLTQGFLREADLSVTLVVMVSVVNPGVHDIPARYHLKEQGEVTGARGEKAESGVFADLKEEGMVE